MTSKTLSWMTFAGIMATAMPFVANPSVGRAASGSLPSDHRAMGGGGNGNPLPACGQCGVKPPDEFYASYAVDKDAVCTPVKPYRIAGRLSTKYYCDGGGYWICDDTTTPVCGPYAPRPACPGDTCTR